jgi:hypothetical protein
MLVFYSFFCLQNVWMQYARWFQIDAKKEFNIIWQKQLSIFIMDSRQNKSFDGFIARTKYINRRIEEAHKYFWTSSWVLYCNIKLCCIWHPKLSYIHTKIIVRTRICAWISEKVWWSRKKISNTESHNQIQGQSIGNIGQIDR